MELRVHQLVPISQANGPGKRAVVWVQGCSLGCPGCFNPETHTRQGGQHMPVDAVYEWIAGLDGQIEGVTFSGGEPLQQRRGLQELLERIKVETNLSTLVFTGYTWDELQRMPAIERLLDSVDVLLSGRFDATRRVASGLIGSTNKTIHFLSARYSARDLEVVPEAEAIITPEGEVLLSGIDPIIWKQGKS